MKLPNADKAIITVEKLRDYLLNENHPKGRWKARFFRGLGFHRQTWRLLDEAFRSQHLQMDADEIQGNAFGRKFQIVAPLSGPTGATAIIKSVWIVLNGEDVPRLVSAFPE